MQLECALSAQNTSLRSTRVSNVLLSYFHTSRPRFDDKYDRNERYECMSMSELLEILSTKPCASFSVDGKRQNQMSYRFRKNRRTHLAFGIYSVEYGVFLFLHAQKSKKRQKRDGMTVHLKNGKSGKPGRKTASD